ncbi:unnamed protein product, partial [Ectocarpus sp. 12 AP-2014]
RLRCCLWQTPFLAAVAAPHTLANKREREREEFYTTAAVSLWWQREKKCYDWSAADPKRENQQRRERKQPRILQPDTGRHIMTFQKLLGPLLKDSAENDVPTATALEGKVVAFYFSASW